MLKLRDQQALKAFRNPFPNPLRQPLQKHHVHNKPAPFTNPPISSSLTPRFPQHSNPLAYYRKNKESETLRHGEVNNIHDYTAPFPSTFDIHLPDLNSRTLQTEVAEAVGKTYLSPATRVSASHRVEIGKAYLFGRDLCTIFPCIVAPR